ncbi:MAG: DUF420 domain-containing protein [Thermodesulfobacteriota bacterium]
MSLYVKVFLFIGLIWANIALILLLVAWRSAYTRRGLLLHRRIMILLTVAAWLFVIGYILQFALPSVKPLSVPEGLVPWFVFHALVACIPLFGAPLLVWARLSPGASGLRAHLNRHHVTYGRILVPLWAFTHIGGLVNFFLVY